MKIEALFFMGFIRLIARGLDLVFFWKRGGID